MGAASLISELKRRRVFRVLVGYGVVSFAVLQIVEPIMHALDLPDSTLKLVVVLLGLGFPVAVVLAWAFDINEGKIKRSDPLPGSGLRAARLGIVLVGVGLLAAAPGVAWYLFLRKPAQPASADAATAPSIAVLPFVNLSSDKEQEYFSDGISEEILNVLARVPDLSVAARTSSFQFKGENLDVAQIAAQLKVRMVLEGSVRKQADKVRITAQLIDAQTGFHLWSQTYDRSLKDIFAIQDEIARAIGDELKLRVGKAGAPAAATRGTAIPEAHDLYLRGLSLWQVRRDRELFAAKESFERAIALDPGYAEAWAGLALCYSVLPDYTVRISYPEAYARGREAAEQALVLDPHLAEAYAALGNSERGDGHQRVAIALFRRAVALRPSLATAHQWLGTLLVQIGEVEQGLASMTRAAELDPRSMIVASNRSTMLLIAGRNAEAIASCAPMLEIAPHSVLCPWNMGIAHLLDGKPELARPFYDTFAREWGAGAEQVAQLFDALAGRRDRHAFARKLAATQDRSWNDPATGNLLGPLDIPVILLLLDEKELALDFIAAQADHHGDVDLARALLLPLMDPIRCDARFRAAAVKVQARDLRADTVCAGR